MTRFTTNYIICLGNSNCCHSDKSIVTEYFFIANKNIIKKFQPSSKTQRLYKCVGLLKLYSELCNIFPVQSRNDLRNYENCSHHKK